MRMKKALTVIAVTALAALGVAACGGDDDDEDETTAAATATEATTAETTPAGGGGATLDISSPAEGLAYDQTELTAQAGAVTVEYNNPQALSHDVVIEDPSGTELGKTELISQGNTSTTVDLQPGTYTFYCDVPGHREGGMEGTLTVK
jgi:plastocyanin